MKKIITVKELREQLEKLEKIGLADAPLYYRDWDDIDNERTEGVYDSCEGVVLGEPQHRQKEDKERAKWCVRVVLAGCAEVEIEADSYDEACEKASADVDVDMVDGWDVDIDECWREEDD